jgi:hypothetical protein
LTIQPGTVAVFTVKRSEYQANFRFCNGASRGGWVDLTKNQRVIFVECGNTPCYTVGENVIKIITRILDFGETEDEDEEDESIDQSRSRWPMKR